MYFIFSVFSQEQVMNECTPIPAYAVSSRALFPCAVLKVSVPVCHLKKDGIGVNSCVH